MTNYIVGQALISLKNAARAGKNALSVPATKLVMEVMLALKRLGYISEVKREDKEISLKITFKDKEPFLTNIVLISKPGLRVYKDCQYLENFKDPLDLVLSTSKGILTRKEAIKQKVGGELIAKVQ